MRRVGVTTMMMSTRCLFSQKADRMRLGRPSMTTPLGDLGDVRLVSQARVRGQRLQLP
jgi:hypothetical protein